MNSINLRQSSNLLVKSNSNLKVVDEKVAEESEIYGNDELGCLFKDFNQKLTTLDQEENKLLNSQILYNKLRKILIFFFFMVSTLFIQFYFENKENIYLDDYRTIDNLFDGVKNSKKFNSLADVRNDIISTLQTISDLDASIFYDVDVTTSKVTFETLYK